MTSASRPWILALAALALPACAAQGSFPSLAPRAAEYELAGQAPPPCVAGSFAAPPGATGEPAAQVADPQLAARVAELTGQARRGQAEFEKILAGARTRIGRAGATGSDGWVAAQQDVSRLEAARAPSVDALADLDALVLTRSSAAGTSDADRQSLLAAAEEIRQLVDTQQAEIDRLAASLSGPAARRSEPVQAPHNEQRRLAGRQAPAASDRGHISPAAPPRADPTGSACRA